MLNSINNNKKAAIYAVLAFNKLEKDHLKFYLLFINLQLSLSSLLNATTAQIAAFLLLLMLF